jgi:hypothetical protein
MSTMVPHEAGLEFRSDDGEPRIRDLDLAERLGYLPRMGANHHQHLTPEARDYFATQLKFVEAIAQQSSGRADFWMRMDRHFAGGMLQLPLSGG